MLSLYSLRTKFFERNACKGKNKFVNSRIFLIVLFLHFHVFFTWTNLTFSSSRPEVFWKKGVLWHAAKLAGKCLCKSLLFNKLSFFNFIKKETLAQVVSCEFCEIYKNIFFTEHVRWLLVKFAILVNF